MDEIIPLAVRLVFRSKGSVLDIPHVIKSVTLFLDTSVELPLDVACKKNSIKLLDRIWESSGIFATNCNIPDTPWSIRKYLSTDKYYRQYQFSRSMGVAMELKNLEMVKWLVSKVQGCKVNSTIPIKAITWGSIELLNFLLESDNSSVEANIQTAEVGLHVDWDRDLLIDAVSSRHCHVMWWVLEHLPHIQHDKNRAMRIAVINGDIPLAEWFFYQMALHGQGTDKVVKWFIM
ncbi:hypothetical protein PHMEG_00020842 [Phytophthora megakarya]|uniref:Uncharacterized protein n=1 Tax=Phytophthora megakarya TaxID=4795 RepID=A0A225VN60_9STRA|nr:hypothetical protein PHMEG_00020842 [Phytophthora megakarya]